jgi:acid phosphatase type 7
MPADSFSPDKVEHNKKGGRNRAMRCKRICVLIAASLLCRSTGFAKVTKGPVLLRVEKNRAAVMWETDANGPGAITYAADPNSKGQVTAEPVEIEYEARVRDGEPEKKKAFIYKVWLKDLKPGTSYEYGVEGDENRYSFKTTPETTDEVTFVVYGDSSGYPFRHKDVFKLIAEKKPDFIVHTGGAVANPDKYEQWGEQYFDIVKDTAASIPIYLAKGSTDAKSGIYEKLFIPPGEKSNYGFDYGPVYFFIGDNCTTDQKELLDTLSAGMAKSKALWKFVAWHIPSVNFGGHWAKWGQPEVMAPLAKASVDFSFSGRSRQYERFRPIAPPVRTQGSYVTFITTGGGGAPLYGLDLTVYHRAARAEYHFCVFRVKGQRITVEVPNTRQQYLDYYTVAKTNGKLGDEYIETAVPAEAVWIHQRLEANKPRLAEKPKKGEKTAIYYSFECPPLEKEGKLILELHCPPDAYEVAGPQEVTLPKEGGQLK